MWLTSSLFGNNLKETWMSQTFALNMIVRNEMANLERCLTSVVDHISCWIIIDTGSTDGTQDYIKSFFDKHKIPGELHEVPFVNFEQARNAALTRAYASPLAYDYLLLIDADMQLLVDDDFPDLDPAVAAFHITQRDGTLVYQNTRIVKRNPPSRYRGVTHEYLETIGPVQQLDGVSMWDYASGANRVYKCERDIALLEAAIQDEPDNARYWFYLAGAYRDSGQTEKAAAAFA
jgi:glycosyltransferase involved in cell wall biosynthesis